MAEPSVDFELAGIEDDDARTMFDQLRRWFEFREDFKYPSVQTFDGSLEDKEKIRLQVPGVVYGYSGMSEFVNNLWIPMEFSVTGLTNRCYFGYDNESTGNSMYVNCLSTTGTKRYRVTVFYRDA